jgi:hypothetical protein
MKINIENKRINKKYIKLKSDLKEKIELETESKI